MGCLVVEAPATQVEEAEEAGVGTVEEAPGGTEQAVVVGLVVVEEGRTVEEIQEVYKHWRQALQRRRNPACR
jgi:hypothetical protein